MYKAASGQVVCYVTILKKLKSKCRVLHQFNYLVHITFLCIQVSEFPTGHSEQRLSKTITFAKSYFNYSDAGFLDDLYEFDPATAIWTNLGAVAKGVPPVPRAYHGFASTAPTQLYVHGGYSDDEGANKEDFLQISCCLIFCFSHFVQILYFCSDC